MKRATQIANQVSVRLNCKAERVDDRWTDSSLNSLMTKAMTKDIFLSVPGVNTRFSAFTNTSSSHRLSLNPERHSSPPYQHSESKHGFARCPPRRRLNYRYGCRRYHSARGCSKATHNPFSPSSRSNHGPFR